MAQMIVVIYHMCGANGDFAGTPMYALDEHARTGGVVIAIIVRQILLIK